jgi:hypothetical protein
VSTRSRSYSLTASPPRARSPYYEPEIELPEGERMARVMLRRTYPTVSEELIIRAARILADGVRESVRSDGSTDLLLMNDVQNQVVQILRSEEVVRHSRY